MTNLTENHTSGTDKLALLNVTPRPILFQQNDYGVL